jgi:heterodisulfide reductase subunit A-like polyferredoxin
VEIVAPFKEVIDEIRESGGDAVKYCYQCGKCDTVCPWNNVTSFSMRRLIREATFGLSEIEREEIWRCTTCGKCPQRCPRDVRQIDDMVALRRIATRYNVFPGPVKSYRTVSSGLTSPLGSDRIAQSSGIELNHHGFSNGDPFNPIKTNIPGIFVSGTFQGPLDIPESVFTASGAASQTGQLLDYRRDRLTTERVYPSEKDVTKEEPRVGVFVCHCGANIGRVVSVPSVVKYALTLPNVVQVM